MDLLLLKKMCQVHAPSGNESEMTAFVLDYVEKNRNSWKNEPEIFSGGIFQDNLVLKFGSPRLAAFAHLDSVGFTVRYQDQLIPIGSPEVNDGDRLKGKDRLGPVECRLRLDENDQLFYEFGRAIERGTDLTFISQFKETKDYVQSCYLDNRLGVYNLLRLAETIENGLLVFSTGEEHGGGSVPFLTRWMYENFQISQALISDITWVTDGIEPGKGVAVSLRDRLIPRRSFINKILKVAEESGLAFQLEVESSGSSDAREINSSAYPVDWCFIGAPEENVHSAREKVEKSDILSMLEMYQLLFEAL